MSSANESEAQKRRAAEQAVGLVEDGMALGLGSGTTAEFVVRALAERVSTGLHVRCVATSGRTERLASELGIQLEELDGELDLAIDGADAIERGTLAAIKGRGGALTREKIVALAARTFVLVADASKVCGSLAETASVLPVPVEILPFGWKLVRQRLTVLGDPMLRERDGVPFVTDNGHYILDLYNARLNQPGSLARLLGEVPGVVDHGLFLGIASVAIIGQPDGVEELRRQH